MPTTAKTDESPAAIRENCGISASATSPVFEWQVTDVLAWASSIGRCSKNVITCIQTEAIDGQVLLALNEDDIRDFRFRLNYNLTFGELKKFWLAVRGLQQSHIPIAQTQSQEACGCPRSAYLERCLAVGKDCEKFFSVDDRPPNIPPEFFKTAISLGYSFLVTWITSFVMVIVHERVPDMKRYPPLPDIFLDNVPHIPWAFHMCEITGTLLFTIWACVCIFHKYRMVLLRRFFALAGTVFLLRCVTMLITSLSVPGSHLQCNQQDYAIDDTQLTATEALGLRIYRAYTIWSGLGMSIQGVRTCGDYMFSGHTVALTLLNFFITEYTPRHLYFLHTLTWLLNMFGIFFILAAHEHYSIDVFVAFYITSRLFLYYHTLANNQALMSRDSNRTRIWFPMFSYFESSVEGIIPNEYDSIESLIGTILGYVGTIKDTFMLTARRYWVDPPHLASKNLLFVTKSTGENLKHRNVATSTHWSSANTPTTSGIYDRGADNQTNQNDRLNMDLDSFMHSPYASCNNDTNSDLLESGGTKTARKRL